MAKTKTLVAIVLNGQITVTTIASDNDQPNMPGDYGPRDIFRVATSDDNGELQREARRLSLIITRKAGGMKTSDLHEIVRAAIMDIQKLRAATQIDHLRVTPQG